LGMILCIVKKRSQLRTTAPLLVKHRETLREERKGWSRIKKSQKSGGRKRSFGGRDRKKNSF